MMCQILVGWAQGLSVKGMTMQEFRERERERERESLTGVE
jgi:hypothetical protein